MVKNKIKTNSVKKDKKQQEQQELAIQQQTDLKHRNWSTPLVLDSDIENWKRPGARIGFCSRIDYKSPGYRSGLVIRDAEIFAAEGCHFNVIAGGLVSKHWLKKRVKEVCEEEGYKSKDDKEFGRNWVLDEAARELASVIPQVKRPDKASKFVRWYIFTSMPYDGAEGEEVARRLQALRPDDVRYRGDSGKLLIKRINKYIWVINPRKHRLPSKYHSTAAEREIEDREGQTSQDLPDVWGVGIFASSLHKPKGERKVAYFTIPASHRLEEVTVAENQEGVRVFEYVDDTGSNYIVRTFPLKDWTRNERHCITGIKDGATKEHKAIVEVIKSSGARTVGELQEALGGSRKELEKTIQFLVEDKMSSRKTWPGLHYNKSSQSYDFHLDWLQETLRYPALKKEWSEDSMLLFGCLHAGYTTTDYEYFVEKYPETILRHNVKMLVGLGDFVAGLKHNMLCRGDVFGGLNYSEQEELAANLVATVIFKVFKKRFCAALSGKNGRKISSSEVLEMVEEALIYFAFRVGNHDDWQSEEGITPLALFKIKLTSALTQAVRAALADKGLNGMDIAGLVDKHVTFVPYHNPVYRLPSGLLLGLHHPYMARAKTTSLRAQELLKASDCQIEGSANFHTAIVTESWQSDLGQRIVAQVGTMVLHTGYELNKMKIVDFGPIYLRVRSQDGRIIMTESGAFPESILKEPIPKWTNLDDLKKKLKLIGVK